MEIWYYFLYSRFFLALFLTCRMSFHFFQFFFAFEPSRRWIVCGLKYSPSAVIHGWWNCHQFGGAAYIPLSLSFYLTHNIRFTHLKCGISEINTFGIFFVCLLTFLKRLMCCFIIHIRIEGKSEREIEEDLAWSRSLHVFPFGWSPKRVKINRID